MNSSEKYEIKARAFQIMTGCLAPGKDSPIAAGPIDMAARDEVWCEWLEFHDKIIRAMLQAFEDCEP